MSKNTSFWNRSNRPFESQDTANYCILVAILDYANYVFPILGFLSTFSMVFWGPHRTSLWQKQLCCNLFQVEPYFAWSSIGW